MTTHRKGICGTFSAMRSGIFDERPLYCDSEAIISKSIIREPIEGLARDRWNVRKMKNEQSDEMVAFYEKQKKTLERMKSRFNNSVIDLVTNIFLTTRWSNPELSSAVQRLVVLLCLDMLGLGHKAHLLEGKMDNEKNDAGLRNKCTNIASNNCTANNETKIKMIYKIKNLKERNKKNLMAAWTEKAAGTKFEKMYLEINEMLFKLDKLIKDGNMKIDAREIKTIRNSQNCKKKNESDLEWVVKKNFGEKDRFGTVWYHAMKGDLDILKRLFSNIETIEDGTAPAIKNEILNDRDRFHGGHHITRLEIVGSIFPALSGRDVTKKGRINEIENPTNFPSQDEDIEKNGKKEIDVTDEKKNRKQTSCSGEGLSHEHQELCHMRHTQNEDNEKCRDGKNKLNAKKDISLSSAKNSPTNSKTDENETISATRPLPILSEFRLLEVRKSLLLNLRSDVIRTVDQKDRDFLRTPLHYACKYNRYAVVKYLLDIGADCNITDLDGKSCLHFSAAYGTKNTVFELLSRGAVIDSKDSKGRIPLDYSELQQNKDTFYALTNW